MYKKRETKWNWRNYLTADEKAILTEADKAKAAWLKLNKNRAGITNRAIQRAIYAARTHCRAALASHTQGERG